MVDRSSHGKIQSDTSSHGHNKNLIIIHGRSINLEYNKCRLFLFSLEVAFVKKNLFAGTTNINGGFILVS